MFAAAACPNGEVAAHEEATPILVATTVAEALPLDDVVPETDDVTPVVAPTLPAWTGVTVNAHRAAAANTG